MVSGTRSNKVCMPKPFTWESVVAPADTTAENPVSMPSNLANYEAESARLHGEIQRLQRSMSTLQQTNRQQADELVAVQEQLKHAQTQHSHEERKALIATVDSSINPERTALVQLQSELELQRRQVAQLENELMGCKASQDSRLEELQQEFVNKVRQMRAVHAAQLGDVQQGKDGAEARLASVVEQATVLEQQVATYRQRCEGHEKQLDVLMKEKHTAGNQLQAAQARVTQLETEIIQLKSNRQKLQQQLKQAQQSSDTPSKNTTNHINSSTHTTSPATPPATAATAATATKSLLVAGTDTPSTAATYIPSFLKRVVASQHAAQQSTLQSTVKENQPQNPIHATSRSSTGHSPSGDLLQEPDQCVNTAGCGEDAHHSGLQPRSGVCHRNGTAAGGATTAGTGENVSNFRGEDDGRGREDIDLRHGDEGGANGAEPVSRAMGDGGVEVDDSILDLMEGQLMKLSGVIRAQEDSMSELRRGLQQQELQQQKLMQENSALQQSLQEWERWKALVLNQGRKAAAAGSTPATSAPGAQHAAETEPVAGMTAANICRAGAAPSQQNGTLRAAHVGPSCEPSSSSGHKSGRLSQTGVPSGASAQGRSGGGTSSAACPPSYAAGRGHASSFPARHHHMYHMDPPASSSNFVGRKPAIHDRQYGRRAGQQQAARHGYQHGRGAARQVPCTAPALDPYDMNPPGTSGSGCSVRSSTSLPGTMQERGAAAAKSSAATAFPTQLDTLYEMKGGKHAMQASANAAGYAWSQLGLLSAHGDVEQVRCDQSLRSVRHDGRQDFLDWGVVRHGSTGSTGQDKPAAHVLQYQPGVLAMLPELNLGGGQKGGSSGSNVRVGGTGGDAVEQAGVARQLSLPAQPSVPGFFNSMHQMSSRR